MFDYLEVEEDLTSEEEMIQDTVRQFAEEELKPDIGQCFIEGEFPVQIIEEMGEMGLFGSNLAGYGLPNISERAYGLIMQELEAADSGIRSFASVQGALVMYPIYRYGSDEQKQRYLPKLGRGELIGCFGLTEPAHGSNPAGMETYAERDGGGYVLNGNKTWITNSPIADVAIVWARDRSHSNDPVRGFIVETDRSGIDTPEIDEKLSLRVSATGEIGINDAHVPEENVLPGVSGMKGPLSCLNQARYGIVWGAVGAATDAFETALQYSIEREQFNNPIGSYQLQQEKLAEIATQITLGKLLAHHLAARKSGGRLRPVDVSMGKRYNVRMARRQTRVAREILGGNGITIDYSPMRHLLNMETVYTYEGTHDIHSLIIGEELTGMAAYN